MSSTTDIERDAVAITEKFIHQFWSGDIRWCASVLAPEFTWIGTEADQINLNAKEFIKAHAAIIKKVPHAIPMNEKYSCMSSLLDRIFIVTAEYFCYSDTSENKGLAIEQRCTFVWKNSSRGFVLLHYHASNPFNPAAHNEALAAVLPKEIYRYMLLVSSKRSYHATVELKDILGNVHVLRLVEIVYLQAQKQSTIVHTTDGKFRLREGISKVLAHLNKADASAFVRIHRSYAVNPLYVKTIKAEEVQLASGGTLPLSTRRRSEAMKLISEGRTSPTSQE